MKRMGIRLSGGLAALSEAARRRALLLSFAGALLQLPGSAPDAVAAYGEGPRSGVLEGAQPRDFVRAPALAPSSRTAPKMKRPILLAHAIVVRTSPPQGGVAAKDISRIDVWYDAGIRDSLAALAVVSAEGQRVDKRDAAIDSADPAHVSVSVNPLSPGKYTVRYRALSADGHLVSGAWDFEVQP
jgi:methionine-rich copper-binding protein CopC